MRAISFRRELKAIEGGREGRGFESENWIGWGEGEREREPEEEDGLVGANEFEYGGEAAILSLSLAVAVAVAVDGTAWQRELIMSANYSIHSSTRGFYFSSWES